MPSPIYRYDLDPTGLSADNRVAREPIVLANYPVRVFVPAYGAFFGASMAITDTATGQRLLATQYYLSQSAQTATLKYGQGIYYCVVVTDSNVSSNLSIDYQALGGEWSYSNSALANQLQLVLGDARAVNWSEVVNKPPRFNPGAHLHDSGDIFGMEYLVDAVFSIRDAIALDNTAAVIGIHENTATAIADMVTALQATRTEIYQTINGLLNQVSSLQAMNARIIALEVNSNVRFVTPVMLQAAIDQHVAARH